MRISGNFLGLLTMSYTPDDGVAIQGAEGDRHLIGCASIAGGSARRAIFDISPGP
jgi:hypothetical protein